MSLDYKKFYLLLPYYNNNDEITFFELIKV